MSRYERTLSFWDRYAQTFNNFYGSGNLVDRLFRSGIERREAAAVRLIESLDSPTLLDLGCGGGKQCVEALKAGATHAVGVDGAAGMLDLARQEATESGMADRVEYHLSDFFEWDDDRTFDVVWALGVFDYVKEPDALVQMMRDRSQGYIMGTFRRIWVLRYPARKLIYQLRGSPVYFYTQSQVEALMERNGLRDIKVERIDPALYLATAKV